MRKRVISRSQITIHATAVFVNNENRAVSEAYVIYPEILDNHALLLEDYLFNCGYYNLDSETLIEIVEKKRYKTTYSMEEAYFHRNAEVSHKPI